MHRLISTFGLFELLFLYICFYAVKSFLFLEFCNALNKTNYFANPSVTLLAFHLNKSMVYQITLNQLFGWLPVCNEIFSCLINTRLKSSNSIALFMKRFNGLL